VPTADSRDMRVHGAHAAVSAALALAWPSARARGGGSWPNVAGGHGFFPL